jgi:anaerobic selenocysteine-containing dehydrogenase
MSTHHRACHLCEAICGLTLEVHAGQVTSIKGDEKDPFSRGHICPKAVALKDIQNDPDRLHRPVIKRDGQWHEISWDEAIERACDGLLAVQAAHGANAVGVYQGNPNVHNWGLMTHSANFLGLLKTKNRFSATSVDQLPAQLMAFWMFGHQLLVPIPDIDHTDYFLMLGANPLASNGSLMTVPDVAQRLKDLKARGGRLVVVDPRKTETADMADAHHAIKPGGDAAFLFALIHTIVTEGRTRSSHLSDRIKGLDDALAICCSVTPAMAQTACGIPADAIVNIARELAAAPRAVVYGRMGACTQRHGSLAQWAIQVLNLITGNLDAVGGSLVTQPAVDLIAAPNSKPGGYGRWHSRVSQRPEVLGEFPCAVMAEEMLTQGPEQIRAMVTVAGNPVLSTPNGKQVDQALAGLDFMVAIDFYINETTRHADLILPTTAPLEHDQYDLIFNLFGVRNQAKYSEPTLPKPPGSLDDWELMDRLATCYAAKADKPLRPSMPPQVILDMGLQMGSYGLSSPHQLSLAKLKENPHGIDLGPLQPSFPQRLRTSDQLIDAAPQPVMQAARQFLSDLQTPLTQANQTGDFMLVGRRHVRSNNSWMHNAERLVKGRDRCTALLHPQDAHALGLQDGQSVRISSRIGEIRLPVELSDSIMPGVVSVPHGWGHDRPGIRMSVAQAHAGVSCNDVTDERWLDELSGNAALNGVPVKVAAD